jgi:ribosomal protein S18 acetylase RimI-like enzyme
VPTIRPYGSSDLTACRALWAELTEVHRELYDDPTFGGDDPGRGFDRYLAEDRPERICVADADGRIVGLAGLLVVDGRAELEPIVVAGETRGGGVGRLLAEAVVEGARELGFPRVRVRPVGRNSEAIRFFHALGFDVLGRVDLRLDLDKTTRAPGERIAGRDFLV